MSRRGAIAAAASLATIIVLGPVGIPAAERDEVLKSYESARGGAERWEQVTTLVAHGTLSAFSMVAPMTVRHARHSRYRLDSQLLGESMSWSWDGKSAWLQGAVFGFDGPTLLEEVWKQNLSDDTSLAVGLLDRIAAGRTIEWVGLGRVDGRPAHELLVTLDADRKETWFLDAETFLEVKRESTTFDPFNNNEEAAMETFYLDFRSVEGLQIPFREERHFGDTRYHVYLFEKVILGTEIPPGTFRLGAEVGAELRTEESSGEVAR